MFGCMLGAHDRLGCQCSLLETPCNCQSIHMLLVRSMGFICPLVGRWFLAVTFTVERQDNVLSVKKPTISPMATRMEPISQNVKCHMCFVVRSSYDGNQRKLLDEPRENPSNVQLSIGFTNVKQPNIIDS